MKAKAPHRGRKQEEGAMRSAYLEGYILALLVWAYEHLDGKILKPIKIVRLPRMFQWEDKKVPCNPKAINILPCDVVLDEIMEFIASSDEKELLLGKAIPNEQEKERKKTRGKKDDNVKEDNVKVKGNGKGKGKGKGKEKEKEKEKEVA
ncbi:hypothetical protein Droror1_Dr00020331 [Drosera rotundifolia]